MTTERIPSGSWSNVFIQGAPGRESVARAAEEASFSLLYDEALALGEEDGSISETGGEDSSNDLLSGCESLMTQLGAQAVQTGTSGSKPFSYGFAERENQDENSVPQVRPAHPDATVSLSAMERVAETNRAAEDSSASGTPTPSTSPEGRSSFSKNRLIEWMDKHAHVRSLHLCAMFFRRGLEAAGVSTADRPASGDAADYGPYLLSHGAQEVPLDSYEPQAGDTAVFDRSELHPFGHIEIFDGERWVSDFVQHGFSPYEDASSTPSFKIYRLS
jgi:hypothetical protein